jgi:hypothetical protein
VTNPHNTLCRASFEIKENLDLQYVWLFMKVVYVEMECGCDLVLCF